MEYTTRAAPNPAPAPVTALSGGESKPVVSAAHSMPMREMRTIPGTHRRRSASLPSRRQARTNPAAAPKTMPVQRTQTGIWDPLRTKLRPKSWWQRTSPTAYIALAAPWPSHPPSIIPAVPSSPRNDPYGAMNGAVRSRAARTMHSSESNSSTCLLGSMPGILPSGIIQSRRKQLNDRSNDLKIFISNIYYSYTNRILQTFINVSLHSKFCWKTHPMRLQRYTRQETA